MRCHRFLSSSHNWDLGHWNTSQHFTLEYYITTRPSFLLTHSILSKFNTCDAHKARYQKSVELRLEKESLLAESFAGYLSSNCTSFWVFFWTSTCHRSCCASWYIVLIESDSTLSQHPSGHLATVAPGMVIHSNPAEVGPGPWQCRWMQLTHKKDQVKYWREIQYTVCLTAEENTAVDWYTDQRILLTMSSQ